MEKEIEFTKHAPQYRVKIKFSNICIVEGAESVQSVKIWTPPYSLSTYPKLSAASKQITSRFLQQLE